MDLDNETKSNILQLQMAAQQNRLVIFVGAGVSASAGVPVWQNLVDFFKCELPDSLSNSNDLLKIAQMYRELRGEVEYKKAIREILKEGEVEHNQIHDAIMELNPCHIVTTNYDDLLEQAALRNNKQYYVVASDEQLPANQGEKMIIKMHGDLNYGNIVLTENDYYDYSRNFPLIRSFLLSLFSTKVVLFVGFSFEDINLKYILREISNILAGNMQRVYLLVDQQKSPIEYSYFQRKGIQLLCMPLALTSALLSNNTNTHIFFDEKSTALFQSLSFICKYDQFDIDLVARAIKFFDNYAGQVQFWGEFLDRVFPEDKSLGFNIRQNVLYLPNNYRSWFASIVETKDSKELFIDKHKDDLERLFEALIDNGITSVEGCSIINKMRLANRTNKSENSTINHLYCLDFEKLEIRLGELQERQHKYTIDDLELPYLLFKLGKYYDAYTIYAKLAPEMWKRRKYILYFICLYNIRSLAGRVNSEVSRRRDINVSDVDKEISMIKLDEILSDLPIDNRVKKLFEEVMNGHMLMKHKIVSSQLNEELSSQRESAKRGGWSINNRIPILLDNFEQLFFFSNKNYILTECSQYSMDAYKSMAEGIINSIMTNDAGVIQTKLKKLLKQNVDLFVFMIKPVNLAKILSLAGAPIPTDRGFVLKIEGLIENLSKESEKSTTLMDSSLLSDYIKNIIMILNSIENKPSSPNIYNPIVTYWHIGRFVEFVPELRKLLKYQKPSAKESINIINCIMHSKTIMIGKNVEDYVSSLAIIAKKRRRSPW